MRSLLAATTFLAITLVSSAAFAQVSRVFVVNPSVSVTVVEDFVTLRISGEFAEGSAFLLDPSTGFIPRLEVSDLGGQSLLIEYVSCQVIRPSGQAINLFIGENGQSSPDQSLIPVELTEQHRGSASDGLVGDALHANHLVKVVVDPSSALLLNGLRDTQQSGVGRASCVISGRLVE